MALLEQWQKVAYNEKADRGELQRFWQRYFLLEKGVCREVQPQCYGDDRILRWNQRQLG